MTERLLKKFEESGYLVLDHMWLLKRNFNKEEYDREIRLLNDTYLDRLFDTKFGMDKL